MKNTRKGPTTAAVVFLLALCWVVLHSGLLLGDPLWGDPAIYIDQARRVADGLVPHRDFFEVKPALAPVLAAPAVLAGRQLGCPDWLAARAWSALLAAMLVWVVYILGQRAAAATPRPLSGGILAACSILALRGYSQIATAGIEPKILVLLFGVGGLALALDRKPLLAGVSTTLAAFCWQPAALAWLVPWSVLFGVPRLERLPFLRRYLLGTVVTAGTVAAALFLSGAWPDFVDQTLRFSRTVVARPERGAATLWRIGTTLWLGFGWELLVAAPLALYLLLRRPQAAAPLLTWLLLFGAWSLFDFQAFPDALVLVIPVMVLGGLGLACLVPRRWHVPVGLGLVLCSLLPLPVPPPWTLAEQRELAAELEAELQAPPATPILALGDVALPLLMDRPTLGRHLYLLEGQDSWIEQTRPGGFRAWVDDSLAAGPAAVVISRTEGGLVAEVLRRRLVADPAWDLWRDLGYSLPHDPRRHVSYEVWIPAQAH